MAINKVNDRIIVNIGELYCDGQCEAVEARLEALNYGVELYWVPVISGEFIKFDYYLLGLQKDIAELAESWGLGDLDNSLLNSNSSIDS